ncbi:MAG: hypothetical protein WBH04_01280, partial [Albidovulum sp.]
MITAQRSGPTPAFPTARLHVMRACLLALFAVWSVALSPAHAEAVIDRIPTQYIAALGESDATSGNDAQTWGHWAVDPGPRGVRLKNYQRLIANGGVAPSGWQFDAAAWWLEENGLIMEAPVFPLPPGQYVVTGGRDVTSILTVEEAGANGAQAWSLA